jgi:hypothetical protein
MRICRCCARRRKGSTDALPLRGESDNQRRRKSALGKREEGESKIPKAEAGSQESAAKDQAIKKPFGHDSSANIVSSARHLSNSLNARLLSSVYQRGHMIVFSR